jgi:hypothetical protein
MNSKVRGLLWVLFQVWVGVMIGIVISTTVSMAREKPVVINKTFYTTTIKRAVVYEVIRQDPERRKK